MDFSLSDDDDELQIEEGAGSSDADQPADELTSSTSRSINHGAFNDIA
jgi:hypothetical protein